MANKDLNQTTESLSNLTLTPPSPVYPRPVEVMYKGLSIPLSWKEMADTIAYDSCTCPPPIVFICGPGNTGKSVFSRVILDTLFKRYKKVGYLETDVGQPEFTAPGCVSLHIIEDETPDLPVLCMKNPQRCLFFGDFCPNANSENYVQYTTNLYNYFIKEYYTFEEADKSHKHYAPLVVNTSGWINGSGLDVLAKMIRCMNPTHVVKTQHSKAGKNLPDGAFWCTIGEKSPADILDICALQYYTSKTAKSNEARQMRELRFIAYFRQCLPKELDISRISELISQLSSLQPFELSLSKINVSYLRCDDSNRMTYSSLMGMIIGLAVNSTSELSLTSIYVPSCVGLGIVRFVDIERGKIFLIAPIPLHIVEKVDVLFQGSIKIPPSLMLGTYMN